MQAATENRPQSGVQGVVPTTEHGNDKMAGNRRGQRCKHDKSKMGPEP